METGMKVDVFFCGEMKTIQPFTFTQPDLDKKSKDADGLPRMNGRLFIPASGLRGKLRRNAVDVVRHALGAPNAPYRFPLPAYYLNSLGGVKGSEKNDDAKARIPLLRAGRAKNPLVSLFGAMSPLPVEGRLKVGHAVDKSADPVAPIVIRHARTNDLEMSGEAWEIVDGSAEGAYAEMKSVAQRRASAKRDIAALEKEIRSGKMDSAEAIDAARREVKAQKAALDDLTDVNVSQVLNYEAIPAATVMGSDFRLMGATLDEVSLFLKALNYFSCAPVLGGRKNHGNGTVSGEWSVTWRPSGPNPLQSAGAVVVAGDFSPLKATGLAGEWLERELPWQSFEFSEDVFRSPKESAGGEE